MADAPSRWLTRSSSLPAGHRMPGRMKSGWFAEGLTQNEFHCHRIKRVLRSVKTQFQECVLADSYSFGRCLIFDGETQSSQFNEFIYHEALVHPAMILTPRARRVLIMGGGEGATAREVLRWKGVEQVVMADIDGQVVDFCKRHMPTWH